MNGQTFCGYGSCLIHKMIICMRVPCLCEFPHLPFFPFFFFFLFDGECERVTVIESLGWEACEGKAAVKHTRRVKTRIRFHPD